MHIDIVFFLKNVRKFASRIDIDNQQCEMINTAIFCCANFNYLRVIGKVLQILKIMLRVIGLTLKNGATYK